MRMIARITNTPLIMPGNILFRNFGDKRGKRTGFVLLIHRHAKCNYVMGVCASFIVVVVVSLMMTIVANNPVIFLRLAELVRGALILRTKAK